MPADFSSLTRLSALSSKAWCCSGLAFELGMGMTITCTGATRGGMTRPCRNYHEISGLQLEQDLPSEDLRIVEETDFKSHVPWFFEHWSVANIYQSGMKASGRWSFGGMMCTEYQKTTLNVRNAVSTPLVIRTDWNCFDCPKFSSTSISSSSQTSCLCFGYSKTIQTELQVPNIFFPLTLTSSRWLFYSVGQLACSSRDRLRCYV